MEHARKGTQQRNVAQSVAEDGESVVCGLCDQIKSFENWDARMKTLTQKSRACKDGWKYCLTLRPISKGLGRLVL